MENTSKLGLKRRDRSYYQQRQRNRVFAALVEFFAEEAGNGRITKKGLADALGKDPSQITRWLSAPSNLELDTISDVLLAMGAEMDYRIVRLHERPSANYVHPLIAPYIRDQSGFSFMDEEAARGKHQAILGSKLKTSGTAEAAIELEPA